MNRKTETVGHVDVEDRKGQVVTQKGGRRLRRVMREIGIWLPMVVLVIWTVTPMLISLSVSLKTRGEVFAYPSLIPRDPTIQAYIDVITRPGFRTAFVNSVLVGVGTAFLTLLFSVPAAYAFARYRFPGRHLLLLFTFLPRLIPSLGLMVPLYRLAILAGAMDKRLTLIIVFTGTLLPLAVWLLVGFFRQIPRAIEEAAIVDGSTLGQRIRYVVMPLAFPAIVTIGVLAFREAWNEFSLVIALTRSSASRTLPYELWLMTDDAGIPAYPEAAAFALLTLVPFIFLYNRIEKYVVSGITSGAVK
jgi:ABC-type glycerol-3-phosphate transport system permease component